MNFFKRHLKILILLSIVAIVFLSPINNYINIESMKSIINSVKDTPNAPIIFVGLYILGIVFALPAAVFMILAGSLFGFWMGLALSVLASNLACQITFFLSRRLGKDFISRFFSLEKFNGKLSRKIDENGFLVILYLRLIPIFPFNAVNYLAGVTNVRHRDYLYGTLLGKLPAMVVYVYMASRVSDLDHTLKVLPIYMLLLGILIALSMFIGKKFSLGKNLK